MAKTSELTMLEESLRDFIIDEYENDIVERETYNQFKYRGLTLLVKNTEKGVMPQFKVQIAMLEAEFAIETGKKLGGGLGSTDERMIERWLDRGNSRQLLMNVWNGKTEDKVVKIQPFDI